jgi:hypothetical protein
MKVIKEIKNYKVTIGGERHTGWLPANASIPQPKPAQEVLLDISIEHDGFGYLLCYTSSDGGISGDTWHETLHDAESAASDYFGLKSNEWNSLI